MVHTVKRLFLLIALAAWPLAVLPQHHNEHGHTETHESTGHDDEHGHAIVEEFEEGLHHAEGTGFDPGTFIFDHIGDAYDWHILSINDQHISLPLPIILISKNNGLVSFFSSKLHHGHSSVYINGYEYYVAHEGENDGKVVEKLPNGDIVRPLDISITKNVASLFISITLILVIFLSVAKHYKKRTNQAPRGIASLFEPIIIFIRDEVAKTSIGPKYEKFTPFLLSIFFFIWINNMLGLIPIIPGGANLTGNIAVTLVLAVFSFLITTVSGNKNYWTHIVNTPGVPWWLKVPLPIMPMIEIFGMFTKPFVLMVRLFANITAGHIIVLGFLSLIFIFGAMNVGLGFGVSVLSVSFSIFMTFLELLVAFIQAYVFTFLSALYFGMAVEEHH